MKKVIGLITLASTMFFIGCGKMEAKQEASFVLPVISSWENLSTACFEEQERICTDKEMEFQNIDPNTSEKIKVSSKQNIILAVTLQNLADCPANTALSVAPYIENKTLQFACMVLSMDMDKKSTFLATEDVIKECMDIILPSSTLCHKILLTQQEMEQFDKQTRNQYMR